MTASATAPRFVHELARPQPGLAPTERVGVAAEWVRVSPYRCVPVLSGGVLLGLVTDASLTRYLLAAPEGPERRRWLEAPVEDTVLIPTAALSPLLSVEALLTALEDEGVDTLPVAEGSGIYLGMVGRSDLVRELLRPLALPQLGGMATPIGVHLSTGAVCAGAGDDLFDEVRASGADVYVTADLRHHPASEALEHGTPALLDCSHWATEWPWLADARRSLLAGLGAGADTVETRVSTVVTDPWTSHQRSQS